MKNTEKIVIGLLFLVLGLGQFVLPQSKNLGGVTYATANNATTTSSTYANTAKLVVSGPAIVGSLITTDDPTAGYIKIWDATSTATSTYQGETPGGTYGRLIAQTAVDIPEGDLTIDSVVRYGIVVETQAGYNGLATITWKK